MINKSTIRLMNRGKKLFIALTVAMTCFAGANAALTKNFYAASSVLSSGKWVKVGVETTGVYEISYDALRAMGFADPSKVSVYGRGGRVLSESFVTNAGVPILTDDLTPVKVLHEGNKIYFYGLGPEEITFDADSSYEIGGYFSRKSNNIYSKRGYYFLTDSKDVTPMSTKNYTSSLPPITKAVSYVYHELDSAQNATNSGQLFWGENIGIPYFKHRSWEVEMPDALEDSKGVMHCELYLRKGDYGYGSDSFISYGFENTDNYFKTVYNNNNGLYYAPHEPKVAQIGIPGNTGKVFVEFDNEDMGNFDNGDFANLDFWVVSYPREIPTMTGAGGQRLNQQLIAVPGIAKNSTGIIEFNNSSSLVVLDVTTATDPQILSINRQGAVGTVGVRYSSKTPVLVVFDKNQPQMQISGYETDYSVIENQNLHSYKEVGADLIIVSTPAFKSYAEEIAALHRKYDSIEVVVATTEECYNEFSGGVPDPMAYRSFARMLYFSDRQPKNILLLGPLYGDIRGLNSERDPYEGIIAYQSPSISISRGAHNINDFYGMMSDKFRTDYYERNDIHLGVGILPVKFESEARIVVDKLKTYLERDDHAYYLNRITGVGGIGDEHTHDMQVRDINAHIRTVDNLGTVFTPLPIDTYGNAEAHKKFISQINEGCNIFSYFGHGAEQFLGTNRLFFNAGDVYSLRNKVLPLALFGGCLITNTDRGFRGLGETIVTDTKYGCIGSIVSARDTWSGQNYEFFKQFYTCLYTSGATSASPRRTKPVTIGEVYSAVKNYSTYSNELAYQLLCDPALIFPTINYSFSVSASSPNGSGLYPGDKYTLKGSVVDENKNVVSDFNGQVVIRLNEPEKLIKGGSVESGEDAGPLTFAYRDEQVSMAVGEVKNGNFEVDIHVPASIATMQGKSALLYFCAYDPSSRMGAAAGFSSEIKQPASSSPESGDNVAPVVENLAFDNTECAVNLAVSDNVALNMSSNPLNKGLYLYIDGKERTEAHFVEPVMESGRAAYSKNILIDGLTYGEHTARIKVKDAAGNATEKEIVFTYNPRSAKYAILRAEDSCGDLTRIEVDGISPAKSHIVILTTKGEEVWRGELAGTAIEWNHVDNGGNRVPPGHYKAYLIETEGSGLKGHSDPIDIPVI